ncbi:nitronate monooxygenase [Staphylococcus arlettae]|uniref:Probable nitronate monooxygenase n=4 Tax=Staphylococcus arlettae TaxID=29378 RepID=A0A2T7BT04_9STAP|nr:MULTISPECIES: nitronate monooxygenase family protein [Staphylococcus]EJY96367.1 dioxygenase [Staphylococcus arlettae CVD059]ERF49792.1 nitronate monooxygenase [Staphylococcus sp. EGD-HP3]KAB2481056.1 nitronate monooxygenase [Staphylococcus sp. CH99b_3]MBF0737210.1 nitronate monooxygenase [Staphylococcus arlettae]MCD8833947.1 nitronate monooxygenase family protein [Staphylococcus arlettae]
MNLTSSVTNQLKIKYPIFQAGMAGSTSPELVAAVSNSGGLGIIGAGYFNAEQLEQHIQEVKMLTSRPFAVNLFVPGNQEVVTEQVMHMNAWLKPYRRAFNLEEPVLNIQEQTQFESAIEIVIAQSVPIVTFTFGVPEKDLIDKLHRHNITVVGTATSVEEAIENERAGLDMVVAQGSEAGGHRGSFLQTSGQYGALVGTMSLVPQIVDNVTIPVIAAGGIMDARGVVASLILGAEAVQMGTAFLTCIESNANDLLKNAIFNSAETDTVITKAFSGKPARGIDNEFIHNMQRYDDEIPAYPIQNELTNAIRKKAAQLGDAEMTHLWSGQTPRLAQSIAASQLMSQIITDTQNILQNE